MQILFYVFLFNRADDLVAMAIVDPEIAPRLSRVKWRINNGGYARQGTSLMHRLIAGTKPGMDTDHINGDRLDNRQMNLRSATRAQNQYNRRYGFEGKSGFKGVGWVPQAGGKWRARISVEGSRLFLGMFDTETEAARAYDAAARIHHGEFAAFNLESQSI